MGKNGRGERIRTSDPLVPNSGIAQSPSDTEEAGVTSSRCIDNPLARFSIPALHPERS
jgi:hypothetical protein